MEHPLPGEIASAVFLLILGAARSYYSVSAVTQPADRSSPAANWARHLPAYIASTVWAIYVAWLVVAPIPLVEWDRWTLDRLFAALLGWLAIPLLGAGLWLFCYSHSRIGRYWSIRIRLKTAHRLVTDGPYRIVRHPLYSALFLGYLGTLLAMQSWLLTVWFPVFVASYLLFASEEECVMERAFGEAYRAYRRRTGMFLPRWTSMRAVISRAVRRWRTGSLAARDLGSGERCIPRHRAARFPVRPAASSKRSTP